MSEAIKELKRIHNKLRDSPGGCVVSERMEGRSAGLAHARRVIRERIKKLQGLNN